MNRDKDFHKKASGVLINANTKDFHRAKNRNRVMNNAVKALGEEGHLTQITRKVDDIISSPSRAEERVKVLETKLAETQAKLEETFIQLGNADEMRVKMDRLEEMFKDLENK